MKKSLQKMNSVRTRVLAASVALVGGLALFAGAETGIEESFDEGIEGKFKGQFSAAIMVAEKVIPKTEFISFDKDDGATGKGCLDVKIDLKEDEIGYAWFSGAYFLCSKYVPPNTPFKVKFQAKSVSGPKFLTIMRGAGHGGAVVKITDQWAPYEVELKCPHEVQNMVFALVSRKDAPTEPIVSGEFKIDDLSVEFDAVPSAEPAKSR